MTPSQSPIEIGFEYKVMLKWKLGDNGHYCLRFIPALLEVTT